MVSVRNLPAQYAGLITASQTTRPINHACAMPCEAEVGFIHWSPMSLGICFCFHHSISPMLFQHVVLEVYWITAVSGVHTLVLGHLGV